MARIVIVHYLCPRCGEVMPFFALTPYFKEYWVCASCRAKVALTDHLLGKLWGGMLAVWSILPIAFVILLSLVLSSAPVAEILILVPLGGLLLSTPFYGVGYVAGRFFVAESLRKRLRRRRRARQAAYRDED